MRDPVVYRIMKVPHHRTGDKWCIYPMYDFAHCLSDSLEGVTHSLCSLEFENNRELYDWFLDQLGVHHPQQIEFAKLEFNYTVLSKRRLRRLVAEGYVTGWDDPRMPTLAGLRRRGYTPESIRNLIDMVGISKANSQVDIAMLEHAVRDDLNQRSPRVMGVLDPLKVVITNYPAGQTEELEAVNNPQDDAAGTRRVPFSRELYIERDDFMEEPPKKYYRLSPGPSAAALCLSGDLHRWSKTPPRADRRCTATTRPRAAATPRRPQGARHAALGVAPHAIEAEARLYDRLFNVEDPTRATISSTTSTPTRSRCGPATSSRAWRRPARYRCQFERWAISAST